VLHRPVEPAALNAKLKQKTDQGKARREAMKREAEAKIEALNTSIAVERRIQSQA
jgi:hypothetical protein